MLAREALATTAPEDVDDVAAMRADQAAHVLDDADDRHAHPLEHREGLVDIEQGDLLGRRHQHGSRDRHGLGEGQLRIGGPRRQIDHQIVQFAPFHVPEELLDRAADERTSPDDGLARRHEELDRDRLHAVPLERQDLLVLALSGLAVQAEHDRDVRAGDVGIEKPDCGPVAGQRHGEVDGHGALADTALAGRDGNHVLDPGEELLCRPRRRAANHRPPGEFNRHNANRVECGVHARFDLVLERARRRCQFDGEGDGATVDDQVLDHVAGHEVSAELRFLDRAQGGHDSGFGDLGHAILGCNWISDGFGVDIVAPTFRLCRRAPGGGARGLTAGRRADPEAGAAQAPGDDGFATARTAICGQIGPRFVRNSHVEQAQLRRCEV